MTAIGIVTDSSCDIPPEVADAHGISIVPLTIRFGEETFVDRVELSADQFWDRLAAADRLPETAAPSPGAFIEAYSSMGEVDGIVCVCLSAALSGTYQAAVLAAEQSDIPVTVIDSQVVSMALGLAVLTAARTAAGGADLETVAEAAADASRRANVIAGLDTLEYLQRGGRIGKVAALVGGLLDIKPLVTLEDGVVTAAGRVRTRSRLVSTIMQHVGRLTLTEAAVLYSGDASHDQLTAALAAQGQPGPIVAELGPVVGTHTGPGVLGVAYLAERAPEA